MLALLSFVAAGCVIPHTVGFAERCTDIMQRAYPSATIEVIKSETVVTSLTTMTARVEGIRTNLPPDAPSAPNLAVECRFDESILTEFRWTAGPRAERAR